jgi:predicted metal-binding protein
VIQKKDAVNPEILQQEALLLGASDAYVVRAADVPVEDAVVEMCRPPACDSYGTCANCPPFVMTPAEARALISRFDKAVFFKIDVEPGLLFSDEQFSPFGEIFRIVSRLEQRARELEWKHAAGLGAGSCKPVLCPDIPCAVLTGEGKCRFPGFARPSMEALGVNVFRLAESVHWPMYQIIRASDPEEIPSAMLAGMVLVRKD